MPGKDLSLPIKRLMVAVFADQNLGDQPGRGHALGNDPFWRRGLMDGPARPAALFGPIDADDPDRGRNPIEHFRRGHTDLMESPTALGAGAAINVDRDLFAGQMIGKALPWGLLYGRGLLGWRARLPDLSPPDVGVEILKTQVQLVRVKPFRAAAILASLQLTDDEAELLDLAALLLLRRHQIMHQLVKEGCIVR